LRSIIGPGAYNIPVKFGKESPKFSMGNKLKDIVNLILPGPGSYQAFPKEKIQSYHLPKSKRPLDEPIKSKSPGPGAYRNDASIGKNVKVNN
jgi:hypothetical protein